MQLEAVTLSGFRGYANPLRIAIEQNTTTLIGRNDAGKSSIFEALDIFFGAKLEITDFTVGITEPIEISCTFSALPSEVVLDTDRSTDLAGEHLLDEHGHLTLVKSWPRSKLAAPSLFAIANHPVFADGVDLLNSKLPALKVKAKAMGIQDADIDDRRTSSGYRSAIWDAALKSGEAVLSEIRVPLSSEDGKSVGTALAAYLPSFHLFRSDRVGTEADKLAQDPASAAIKAVLERHEAQLEALSLVVQAEVTQILTDVVARLEEVAPNLAASLTPTDPSPNWSKAFSGLQFIDENGIPLSKRGSGTRRLVLLSFFRATAERELDSVEIDTKQYRRGVITAVEEPETALHADLQTDIVSALQDVGDLPHRQVLLTTHSANLIRLVPASSIRYLKAVQSGRECVTVAQDGDSSELMSELNRSLGVFTDHNVRCFILIEGRNDVNGLKALSKALEDAGVVDVLSLPQLESDGLVCFMPIGGGGNASLWESNLSPFRRHEVHIMDSDRLDESYKLKPEMIALSARADDRRHVFVLDRRELENYLTAESILDAYVSTAGFPVAFEAAQSALGSWDYIDIPSLCAQVVHELNSVGGTPWDELELSAKKSKGSRAKKHLVGAFSHISVVESMRSESNDVLVALQRVSAIASRDA